jgi:tetratricopeptide (TPR) repeat protein
LKDGDNLPIRIETFNQETRSLLKFHLLVPEKKYLVRTELGGDYGVDLILELKRNLKYMTNFRVHIQLKSNSTRGISSLGKYDFSIPVKTMNYLLNQPNSLFVVYVEKDDIFLWEWVSHIEDSIRQCNVQIETTSLEKIKYSFEKVLNESSFDEIYNHVQMHGQFFRELSKHTIHGYEVIPNVGQIIDVLGSFKEEYEKAVLYENEGSYKKALRTYERISTFLKTEHIYLKCAVVSEYCDEFNKAIKFCGKLLKLDSQHYAAHIIKGTCFGMKSQYQDAIKWLEAAVQLNESTIALNNLAYSYWRNWEISKAILIYKKLLELISDVERTYIYINIAICYNEQYQFSNAYKFINKALSLEPNNPKALAVKGGFERFFGRNDVAELLFRKSLNGDPNNYKALLGVALALTENNKIDEAALYFGIWIKEYKDSLFREKKDKETNNILAIDMNWKTTLPIMIKQHSSDRYAIVLIDGTERQFILSKNDRVGVGFISEISEEGLTPIMSIITKEYEHSNDAKKIIDQIKKNVALLKLPESNYYCAVDDSIEVKIQEYKDSVFFSINFNGCGINGTTNPSITKDGFRGFLECYNKMGEIQITLQDVMKSEIIHICGVKNVEIKPLPPLINN